MEVKKKRNFISYELKKEIYKDHKKNNMTAKELWVKYGINVKSIYVIIKKLWNDEEIQGLHTSSSEITKENWIHEENEEKENEEHETEYIEENEIEKDKEKWETEKDKEKWENEESNETETENEKPNLIDFLNKNNKILIEEKQKSNIEQPIINLEIEQPTNNNIEFKEIKPIKWILKKTQNILPDDIELCTNNKNLDLQNNEKNNYIIKIRKYYDIFNDDLKNIITKQKINSLFKLEVEELKSIYFLLKMEIQYNTSLNIEYLADTSLTAVEKIWKIVGVNLDGFKDDLLTNELFIKNLQIIGIENSNIYEFLTPKKIILLLLLKTGYKRFEINNLNNKIEKITTTKIDENLKEKYKNI